ncbi:MAG: DUF5119 domain-containing protein [Rikenellaceae bacterium]
MRRLIGIFILMLLITSSCRDHLYYGTNDRAIIDLDIDWSAARLTPNGVSVAAYRQDGTLQELFRSSNASSAKISLPQGIYDLVIYNNTDDEFKNVVFRGAEKKSTYEAYATDQKSLSERIKNALVSQPDVVATACVDGLEITSQMVEYYYDRPLDAGHVSIKTVKVTPRRVTITANIRAHVCGLSYAAGAPLVQLRNLSGAYFIGKNVNSSVAVAYEFIMNNRTFDQGSTTDGMISNSISTFGLIKLPDGSANRSFLDFYFTLIDGSKYPISIDVTDKIIERASEMELTLELDVDIKLPNVAGDEDIGAFDPTVGDWQDTDVAIEM